MGLGYCERHNIYVYRLTYRAPRTCEPKLFLIFYLFFFFIRFSRFFFMLCFMFFFFHFLFIFYYLGVFLFFNQLLWANHSPSFKISIIPPLTTTFIFEEKSSEQCGFHRSSDRDMLSEASCLVFFNYLNKDLIYHIDYIKHRI